MNNQHIPMILICALLTITSLCSGCNESDINDPEDHDSLQVSICDKLYPPTDTLISSHTSFTRTNYPARIKVFQADTIDEGDIVMLGNSLTQQGGNWGFKLDRQNVKNRGIAGDNTDGVLARLNELICRKPSIIFIMIGTNDLFIGYGADRVAANIKEIGSTLVDELPNSRVIVQTIMPLGAGNDKKSKLIAINELLKGYDDTAYELLDTYQYMANEAGDLPQAYTYDGVHLTDDGYARWVELLKTQLEDK